MKSRKGYDEDGFPDHVIRWLDGAMRRIALELERTAAESEAAGTPYLLTTARPSQRRLLSMIGADGERITDLALRSGMTKQAVGELVDSLERDDLARSEQDPSDRRVRLVRRTARGTRAVEESVALIVSAEARLRREIGARRYDDMVQVLREISRGGARRQRSGARAAT